MALLLDTANPWIQAPGIC